MLFKLFECFGHCENKKDNRYFKVRLGFEKSYATIGINGKYFCSNEMHVIEEWNYEEVVESITEKMCFEALCNGVLIKHFPKKFVTQKICFAAVSNYGGSLNYVPKHMKTPQMCFEAVSNYGLALNYVPEHMKTPQMCFETVSNYGLALEFVPENMKTFQICHVAVLRDKRALDYVYVLKNEKCF